MAQGNFKFKFQRHFPANTGFSGDNSGHKIAMDDDAFFDIRDLIYSNSGIYYNESKKYLLESRIGKRLRDLGFDNFFKYLELIKSDKGKKELTELYKVITINETYFFRSPQQFNAFEKILVPEIIKKRESGGKKVFRIWSAASSTGEEAYSLAIIVKESLQERFPDVQFRILASDISNAVLQSARKGVYKEYSLRNMPEELIGKYFKVSAGSFILNDEIKKMVKFTNLNLYDKDEMSRITDCDVIFCCNVLIYFDMPSKKQVVENLFNSLNSGGYLFVGYSESLHGVTKDLKLVHLPQAMAYKKE